MATATALDNCCQGAAIAWSAPPHACLHAHSLGTVEQNQHLIFARCYNDAGAAQYTEQTPCPEKHKEVTEQRESCAAVQKASRRAVQLVDRKTTEVHAAVVKTLRLVLDSVAALVHAHDRQ